MEMELAFGKHNKTVQFPISRYDVEYFQQLRNPSESDRDSIMVTLYNNDLDVNISVPITEAAKFNALAEKIQILDEVQKVMFTAYMRHVPSQSIDDMIRAAETIDAIICVPIGNKQELGEFLLDNEFFEAPDSVINCLDAKRVAERWLKENEGRVAFDEYGYYEDNRNDELKHYQVQISEKEYEQFDNAFFITDIAKDGQIAQVRFPCTDEELDAALKEIGAKNREDCEISNVRCRYQALDDFSDYKSYNLEQQQELSKTLFPLSTAEFQKLQAVAEMHFAFVQDGHFYDGNQEVAVITDTAQTLNQYEFYPPATKWNDIAAEQFRKQNPELYEEFKDCIDYKKAERDGLINNKVVMAPSGYVVCTNQDALAQTQKILEQAEPEMHYTDNGMGGMSSMTMK